MYQFPYLRIPASLPTVTKSLLWNFWEIPNLHFLSCNLVFFTKWVGKNEHVLCGEAVVLIIWINKTGHGYLHGSQEALFSCVSQAPTVCSGLWLWKLLHRFWVRLHDRYVLSFRMQGLEGQWGREGSGELILWFKMEMTHDLCNWCYLRERHWVGQEWAESRIHVECRQFNFFKWLQSQSHWV